MGCLYTYRIFFWFLFLCLYSPQIEEEVQQVENVKAKEMEKAEEDAKAKEKRKADADAKAKEMQKG